MGKRVHAILAAVLLMLLSGCTTSPDAPPPMQATGTAQPTTTTTQDPTRGVGMDATRVRFSTGDTEIVIRVADNPTSRDFVSRLPLTLKFEEFAGREKISYLSKRLATEGSPGSAPRNGDLIYYAPWGNLAFYYNAHAGAAVDNDIISQPVSGIIRP